MSNVFICKECGKTDQFERSTRQFCSDECRDLYNRRRRKMERKFESAMAAIRELAHAMEEKPELSHDLAVKLLSIQKYAGQMIPVDSWWHCANCWTSVHKQLPGEGDCSCDNPDWRLTQKLF